MKELFIEAKIENVDTVIDFVNEQLGDCKDKIKKQIEVVVDEIFSNIARYAYQPHDGNVMVRIVVDDDVTIEFEDSGTVYNPLQKEDPDISLSSEDREIGGLGIFMVKNIMDVVEYQREGDKNILRVKKKL